MINPTTDPDQTSSCHVFLPYAYREKPFVDRCCFCQDLQESLAHLKLATEIDVRRGRRMGIVITSTAATDVEELWEAIASQLPERMFDTTVAKGVTAPLAPATIDPADAEIGCNSRLTDRAPWRRSRLWPVVRRQTRGDRSAAF